MKWIMALFVSGAAIVAASELIKQHDLLLGHTIGTLGIVALAIFVVDRLAREL